MSSTDSHVAALLRSLRASRGLTQSQLARLAETSQPAVARYERGATTPSWSTLQRLAASLGHELSVRARPLPDEHDLELAQHLLGLSPAERLATLRRYVALREHAEVVG